MRRLAPPARRRAPRAKAASLALTVLATLAGALVPGRARADESPGSTRPALVLGDYRLAPLLELRTRGEYKNRPPDLVDPSRAPAPRVEHAGGAATRARLGVDVEREGFRARILLQDARAWGEPRPTGAFAPSTSLAATGAYEAFVDLRTRSDRPTWLRVGRQAVRWGEGRLLGEADRGPAGRSLDAVRAATALGPLDVEALGAYVARAQPLGAGFGEVGAPAGLGATLGGARASLVASRALVVEFYGLARVRSFAGRSVRVDDARTPATGSPSDFDRMQGSALLGTAALRLAGDAEVLRYGVEGALQGGPGRFAQAFAARVELPLPTVVLEPVLRATGSYASGHTGSRLYRQFDPLLPDVQVAFGPTDLFAWSNHVDVGGAVDLAPHARVRATLGYRHAWLATAHGDWVGAYLTTVLPGRPGLTETSLGHELSGALAWRVVPEVDVRARYAALAVGAAVNERLWAEQRLGPARAQGLSQAAVLELEARLP